jgi:hypothetical protein
MGARRAGNYEFLRRRSQTERDAELVSPLRKIREKYPDYGMQSMTDELPREVKCSYGKGYRRCREISLLTKKRRPRCITKPDPSAQKSESLVNRDFSSDRPGAKWYAKTEKPIYADIGRFRFGIAWFFHG